MARSSSPEKTPLHAVHRALDARMAAFGGYEMPIQYSGIIDEHCAVRQQAGLFDVSHMGEIMVHGPEARAFIQQLVTNDAETLFDGRAMYTVMCQPDGGIVDDLLVYQFSSESYMLVVNAANIEKDENWMRSHNPMEATLEDISPETALLAVQGPEAPAIVQKLTDEPLGELKYYHFMRPEPGTFLGCDWAVLSRTGYTGEPGYELYVKAKDAERVWQAVQEAGRDHGLKPAGLGARDTLRLEAGLCLYGQDITEETNPLEAGLGWLTKLDKGEFIGRQALSKVKATGPDRKLVGFVMEDRGIPRQGYPILDPQGEQVGFVTSGSQSPVLEKGIGLGYVTNQALYTEPGRTLAVEIRGRARQVTVKKPPFHKT